MRTSTGKVPLSLRVWRDSKVTASPPASRPRRSSSAARVMWGSNRRGGAPVRRPRAAPRVEQAGARADQLLARVAQARAGLLVDLDDLVGARVEHEETVGGVVDEHAQ